MGRGAIGRRNLRREHVDARLRFRVAQRRTQLKAEDVHARNTHAAVAAGQVVELEKERVEQHAEGERQHAEKDADVTNAEKPDGHRDQRPRQHDSQEHDLERCDPELPGEDGRAIGAEAEEHGVTERQQTGVAEEQIEPQ